MPLRILRSYEECGDTRWPTTVSGLKRLCVRYGPHLNVCFWTEFERPGSLCRFQVILK